MVFFHVSLIRQPPTPTAPRCQCYLLITPYATEALLEFLQNAGGFSLGPSLVNQQTYDIWHSLYAIIICHANNFFTYDYMMYIYIYIRSEYKTHLELYFCGRLVVCLPFVYIFSFIPVTVKSGWALHRQINSTSNDTSWFLYVCFFVVATSTFKGENVHVQRTSAEWVE